MEGIKEGEAAVPHGGSVLLTSPTKSGVKPAGGGIRRVKLSYKDAGLLMTALGRRCTLGRDAS